MILLIHIIIALATVLSSVIVAFVPSYNKITVTKMLALATFTSGTYLVVLNTSKLVSSCVMGLLVLGSSVVCIKLASSKLEKEKTLQ